MSIRIIHGDCLVELPKLAAAGERFHCAVTDPPYMLNFMSKSWDRAEAPPIDADFANWFAGFVDGEGCFSVHKKYVNGCETYDCQFVLTLRADDKPIILEIQRRLGGAGSIADRSGRGGNANPQVRYCISSRADCALLRAIFAVFPLRAKKRRDFDAWCHALDCWQQHKTGEWESMAYYRDALMAVKRYGSTFSPELLFHYRWARAVYDCLLPGAHLLAFGGTRTVHRMACAIEDAGFEIRDTLMWIFASGFPKSHNLHGDWEGWGTALQPAYEPIIVARKPLDGTVAANVLKHGCGALNIDASRIEASDKTPAPVGYFAGSSIGPEGHTGIRDGRADHLGRWPANLLHDGSEEVRAAFPAETSITGKRSDRSRDATVVGTNWLSGNHKSIEHTDSGSAARFFKSCPYSEGEAKRFHYSSKADASDRQGSKHPTVKPTDLMRYLVRLVCPPNGVVLDPFAGTGSTGLAADQLGFDAVLIEQDATYAADARRKIGNDAGLFADFEGAGGSTIPRDTVDQGTGGASHLSTATHRK